MSFSMANYNPVKMANKRRRVEETTSDESDDEVMPGSVRDPVRRRFSSQLSRERRRRRLLVIRRLKRLRRSGVYSTSSEGELFEDMAVRRRRPRRYKNVTPILTLINPAPAIQQVQRWYHIYWRDIAFAVLSIIILIMFLETHIETWITGRPPYRFSCYLGGLIVCCALWCLVMMQDDFDGDLY